MTRAGRAEPHSVHMKKLLLAAAAVVALAGCTSAPPPEPVASPSASSASPTPSPTPEPKVDEVVITSAGLRLLDDGAELDALGWFDLAEESIAALTNAFGSEPEEVPYPGHIEAAPGTDYKWDGFVFRVQDFEAEPPLWSNISVISSVSRVGDVAICTGDGLTIGSPTSAVQALNPPIANPYEHEGLSYTYFAVEQIEIESPSTHNFVGVRVENDRGLVVELNAPSADYGV